jgi:hypothetical protein
MTKKIILPLIFLIILPSLLYLPPKSKATPTATISVNPPVLTGLEIGDTFTIDIIVTDVTDLYSWQFPIYYKSSVLNATGVSEGPFLKQDGAQTFFAAGSFTDNYNATHGLIFIGVTRYNVAKGVDGTGVLATISFKAIAYGNSPLYLDPVGEPPDYNIRTKLVDSAQPFGNLISHTVNQGRVHVGLIDVAIINVQFPLSVPKGNLALINVTVENQGRVTQTFDITLLYGTTPIGTQTVVDLTPTEIRTYTFPWDTNPIPIGDYPLTATATIILGETDTEDNTYNAGFIYVGKRNIALINTHLSKTCTNDTIVYINATVTNKGEANAQFNITAHLDTNPIETKTNINLAPGVTTHLIFTLDTSKPEITKGVYTISVTATPVPGETETADNTLIAGTITETIRGDVTGDFKVDIMDVFEFAKAFNRTPGHPKWNPNCDLNNDGKISIEDIFDLARNYGKQI